MKVTAFIRKTAKKNDVDTKATIYFRLRDGKKDIKMCIRDSIVPVRNSLAAVVYTVEHDMHVRMLPVLMAHDDILRIGNFHFTHIFLRKLYHLLVCQFGCIHCRIA